MKDLEQELFYILMDYGDFFLRDYPKQAKTKSIHPTIKRIKYLFKNEWLERDKKRIAQFVTYLHRLYANIPLTFGKDARKMAKEMIEKWEKKL